MKTKNKYHAVGTVQVIIPIKHISLYIFNLTMRCIQCLWNLNIVFILYLEYVQAIKHRETFIHSFDQWYMRQKYMNESLYLFMSLIRRELY